MHYYTRLYSANHSLRSPVKERWPTPQPPLAPATIVAAPLPAEPHVAARNRSGRRTREVYVAPPRPVTSAPIPSTDPSVAVARLEEEVHTMSRKLDQFVSSVNAAAVAPPPPPPPHYPPPSYYEPSYGDSVHHQPPRGPYGYYHHNHHRPPTSDVSFGGSFYPTPYHHHHDHRPPYQGPFQPDMYHHDYHHGPQAPVAMAAPPSSSFVPLRSSASSLGWYHTQVLPDPQDVAASLYGGLRSPTPVDRGIGIRAIPPRPQLSPLRPHSSTAVSSPLRYGPAALPLPIVEVPPPPVMPSYPPARDDVEAVASSYAWLALRHMMRDVEDAERKDRIRILEEELLNLDTLHEAKRELNAVREREQKRERLAALDAEALLRHHLSNVARGELHRERVTEDFLVSHVERESSPEGRHARSVVQERSRSPMPLSDRRSRDVIEDDLGEFVGRMTLPPSPTRTRRFSTQLSPYSTAAPDVSTVGRRSAAAVSFVSSSSSPPPAATSQRQYAAAASRTPSGTTPLADLSEALGYTASIRRDVAAAEIITCEADNSRARRLKKKMLMQEALR